MKLRITLEDFSGTVKEAYYNNFKIENEVQSLAKKLVIMAFSLIKHPFSRGPGRL